MVTYDATESIAPISLGFSHFLENFALYLCGKVLPVDRVLGVLCEELPGTAQCCSQLVPASSNHPTAEHNRHPLAKLGAPSVHGFTYLRKGKMLQSRMKSEEKYCVKNNGGNIKVSEEKGAKYSRHQRILYIPWR